MELNVKCTGKTHMLDTLPWQFFHSNHIYSCTLKYGAQPSYKFHRMVKEEYGQADRQTDSQSGQFSIYPQNYCFGRVC